MATNTILPIISNGLLVDSSIEGNLLSVLETAWDLVREDLRNFAQSPEFVAKMEFAFGVGVNPIDLRQAWLAGQFTLPPIEIHPRAELNGADGAFAVATGKIYLAQELLENRALEEVVPVLLEEYGHFVDAQLNAVDAPGDEGAIFSALVRGKPLAESELSALKTEDDTATLQLDGQVVQVEQAGVVFWQSTPSYGYTIIAKANTLDTSINRGVSINDQGKVAFVGDLLIAERGQYLYVGEGSESFVDTNGNGILDQGENFTDTNGNGIFDVSYPIKLSSGSGSIQLGVQINNQNQVVAQEIYSGGTSSIFTWNLNNPDLTQLIATGGPLDNGEQLYNYNNTYNYPGINNNGSVIFTADGSWRPAGKLAGDILVSGPWETPIDRSARPMIADNGEVVVRLGKEGQTNATGPASPIVLFNYKLGSIPETIARAVSASDPNVQSWDYDKKVDLLMGFQALGQSPGISDDGQIVTFYGDLSDPSWLNTKQGQIKYVGSSSLQLPQLTRGPGIFASVAVKNAYRDKNFNNKFDVGESTVDRVIVRIAGTRNGFDSFDPNSRVAVNSTQRSESFTDSNNDGTWNSGESFVDSSKNGQFDPSQKSVSVLYKGYDLTRQDILSTSRLDFSSRTDADFNPDQPISLTVSSPRLVVKDGQTINGLSGVVEDFDINDSINNKGLGDVAFWVHTSTGDEAVIRAQPPMHKPVLIVPGIGGTLATRENYNEWLLNRGLSPEKIQIDPQLRAYDDLIQSFKNAGYVEGEDLFVANYDWRLTPGPDDGIIDGKISGLTAKSITDDRYDYGVDYLGYWLRKAAESWNKRNPNSPLDSVDVIAHSTGGLVTRSYIQSDAYGQPYDLTSNPNLILPKINNFMMIGVPNRGASKAWNPLHDNWAVDPAYAWILSKILNQAYQKVQSGQTIKFNGAIGIPEAISQPVDPISFIEEYLPTARSLLATYPFLKEGENAPRKTVNGTLQNPNPEANSLLLDLNNGLDLDFDPTDPNMQFPPLGDPNAFADKVNKLTVIYGTNENTPTSVDKQIGPKVGLTFPYGLIVPFANYKPIFPSSGDVWYKDNQFINGDGTVPLESSIGQFLEYPKPGKIELKPFIKGFNTQDTTGHTDLMSNVDIQKSIFNILGVSIPEISTNLANGNSLAGLTGASYLATGKIVSFLKDPVEGFLVDASGNRLGYTQKDGYLAEIPNSVWFGKEDGIGWIFGEVQDPLTLHLTGLGGNYYVQVGSQQDSEFTGFEDSGFLALGEQKTFVLSVKNHPPIAVDDAITINNTNSVTINVLSNDSDIDTGNTFTIDSVTQGTGGTVTINQNNTLTFTPNANFNGQDTFTYQIKDNAGAKSNPAIVRVTDATRIITVNSTGDQADANLLDDTPDVDLVTPGIQTTLRSAIQFANEKPGKNLIYFNIPTTDPGYNATTGTFTIKPQSALPAITDSIIIDGTTQNGFTDKPIIELNGNDAGNNASGLIISAGDSTVQGLVINRFRNGSGIVLKGKGNNTIEGNFIGTDVTGVSVGETSGSGGGLDDDPYDTSKFLGNGMNAAWQQDGYGGILIEIGSDNNIIGGNTTQTRNIISGNSVGVIVNSKQNQITGNYIGTDVSGTLARGNPVVFVGDFFTWDARGRGIGIVINGSENVIGGNNEKTRNIISGNGGNLLSFSGDGSSPSGSNVLVTGNQNQILGNYVGTDVTGTSALSQVTGSGLSIEGQNNIIGGTTTGSGNLISGNSGSGVVITYPGMGNLIQGNLIGTQADGVTPLKNSGYGISIYNGNGNIIGGQGNNAFNTIAFNGNDGIAIPDSGYSDKNSISFNQIFSNDGNGISTMGSNTDISSNKIFDNTKNGVLITGAENIGNKIISNTIFNNGNLGIDLGDNGVTPNDNQDADTGPNNLQNYPSLITANSGASTTNIEGTLSTSKANAEFLVEFFSNSSADSSGYGEGESLLGSTTVITDNNGFANFTATFPVSLTGTKLITSTATAKDKFGNLTDTSEFSQAIPISVATGAELSINDVSKLEGNSGTTEFTFTVSLSQSSTQTVTVSVETADGTATLFDNDYQKLNSTLLTFNPTETSKTVAIQVKGDTKPESDESFFVKLKNPTNATITDSLGLGTIQTDEPLQTVIVVNSTGDQADANPFDGLPDADLVTPGLQTTLRSAIEFANVVPGINTIQFNLSGSEPYIIQPTTELPEIYRPIIIDGTSQPGYTQTPLIQINGSKVTFDSSIKPFSDGLNISAGNSTVKGLEIANFGAGIWLNSQGNNFIESNYAHDNGFYSGWTTRSGGGVWIDNVANNVVSGNVLSGNLSNGVDIKGINATNNLVEGNYIGVAPTGTDPQSNFTGIWIHDQASNNTIGGTTSEYRNLISGNNTGVSLESSTNILQGNYIGTDVTGQIALGNSAGIWIGSSNNQIGGTSQGAGNVISGNSQGIYLRSDGENAKDNLIQGNLIGTAADGISPLGNTAFGIYIQQGYGGANGVPLNNLIGGSVAGAGNVIAFNGSDYSSTPGDDGAGVRIDASGNSVIHNSIFSNLGNGVEVNSPVENANAIQTNRIFSNTKLGIDLGGYGQNEGVTPNDLGDGDIGQNKLQNYPIITAVTSNDSSTTVAGILSSTANTLFTLEFFSNSERDPSGFGEGENFLGSTVLKTDLAGTATFNLTFSTPLAGSQLITATATDPAGNTSEFSQAFAVTVPNLPSLSINDVQLTEGNTDTKAFTFNVSLSAASSSPVTVQYTTSPDSAKAGEDYITTSGTLTFNPDDPLTQTITVPVIGDTTLEPDETFFLYLGSPTNAKVAGGKAVATILNDDILNNHSPIVPENKTFTVLEDAAATSLGIAMPTDADNDILSLTINSFPTADKGEIYLNGTKVTQPNSLTIGQLKDLFFVPVANANGAAGTFSYTVSDGKGGTATQIITLDITPVNDPPIANNDTASTQSNQPVSINILANDSDIDSNSISLVSFDTISSQNGKIIREENGTPDNLTDDKLLYTPAVGFSGTDSFSYTISDGTETSTATVSITVNSVVNIVPGTQGRDTLTGTDLDDILIGNLGADILIGNKGKDQFVYQNIRDAGDIIKDFEINQDKIVLTDLLDSFGYSGSNPITDGYLKFGSRGSDAVILIDEDGLSGPKRALSFITVEGLGVGTAFDAMKSSSNFIF
jgi:hypothetical protein